jgi:catechol 2,3-dioxygenase-like lactoylglutathione lyase family enzyme
MEVLYGDEQGGFSSLRAKGAGDLILNLEEGRVATPWGRLIFYVPDVDEFSTYLNEKGFQAESPRDGSWGERYFHLHDPDGHELSFARPIR